MQNKKIEYSDFVKENTGVFYTSIPAWKAKKIQLKTGDEIDVIIIKKEEK